MTVFVTKGDKPITDAQLQRRTQALIERDWPQWKRERAVRTDPADLNAYMDTVATDTDVNRANNLFNQQLAAYKQAVTRLAQYQLSVGRPEIREMQPTGEQTFDEATGEMVDVMQEVVVQTAVDPLPATVEVTTYPDDPMSAQEPITEIVPNPLIVADDAERAEAQAVIDATPQAVAEAATL